MFTFVYIKLVRNRFKDQVQIYFNETLSFVSNLWKQLQGNIKIKLEQHRPRATTAKNDSYLSITAWHNSDATNFALYRDFCKATEDEFQRLLFQEDFKKEGLFSRRLLFAFRSLLPTRQSVLAWCRDHRGWNTDQWPQFSSIMSFGSSKQQILNILLYGKKQDSPLILSSVREIDHNDNGGLSVWAGIMFYGHTFLHVIERGTVTGVKYQGCKLRALCLHFQGCSWPGFHFNGRRCAVTCRTGASGRQYSGKWRYLILLLHITKVQSLSAKYFIQFILYIV